MNYWLRQWMIPLFTLALLSPAMANGQENTQILNISEESESVLYGEYVEVEVSSTEDVQVRFTNEVTAFGMEIQKVSATEHLIYGIPLFTERLCFEVEAKKISNNETSYEWLCLYGEDNNQLEYPQITTSSLLTSVKVGEQFTKTLEVDSELVVTSEMIGDLPSGVRVNINRNGNVTLSGKITSAGLSEFVLKVEIAQEEIAHYKQFSLEVVDNTPTYQCAPGYYYDEYLKYCVQDNGSTCGAGTYYDWNLNQCVSYRSNSSCRAGTYYDHWSNRCIRSSARSCPINYSWSSYYNSCTRLRYSCSIGQTYSYRHRTCVSAYSTRSCSRGTHWNYSQQRCVVTPRVCRPGEFWGGQYCQQTRRACRGDRYYSPSAGACVSRPNRRAICNAGAVYDSSRGTCVRRDVRRNTRCSNGSRYSTRQNSCVRHDNRRVERHPRRHRTRPTTRPDRPTRPTTRPDRPTRPTTRPERPTRPTRPTTRPDRPTRPTTRPDRPTRPTTRPDRPTRPTTRPDRPTRPTTRPERPTRPTTRPERPTRPTTRPERPTRPTTRPERPTRPTTRPDRPTRPTTRPERPTRPTTRPERPTRPTTRPERPTRPTTRPERPTRPTTRPERPTRGGSGSGSGSGECRRRRGCD